MTLKTSSSLISLMGALVITGVVFLSLLTTPTLAGPSLPPRDPSPVEPSGEDKSERDGPIGSYLELNLAGTAGGAWTVVQWQDSAGNWHDVEGWQGTLDSGGGKRWWVAAKDFGKGPFRWVLKQGSQGPVLSTSAPFTLPHGADEILQIPLIPN